MKKEITYPLLVYHDRGFADQTKVEIEKAKEALQKLIDCWNKLNLPPFPDLLRLVFDPVTVHAKAVTLCAEPVANGKYEFSPGVFLNLSEVPCPNELYVTARNARNQIQSSRPELWSIVDNIVVLNQQKADQLIHSNDIYAENEKQASFADLCVKYVYYSNTLNEELKLIPTIRLPCVPFGVVERSFPWICGLHLEVDQVREIIKSM